MVLTISVIPVALGLTERDLHVGFGGVAIQLDTVGSITKCKNPRSE